MPKTLTITLLKEDDTIFVKDIGNVVKVGENKYLASQSWGVGVIEPVVNLLEKYLKDKVDLPDKIEFTYRDI